MDESYKNALYAELVEKYGKCATIHCEEESIHIYSRKNFGYLTIWFKKATVVSIMVDDPIKRIDNYTNPKYEDRYPDLNDYIVTHIDLCDPKGIDKIYKDCEKFMGA